MHQMWLRLSPLFSTAGINLEQFLPSELDAGASVLEHLDNAKTFVDDVAASVIGNEEADTLGLAPQASWKRPTLGRPPHCLSASLWPSNFVAHVSTG